MFIGVLLTTLVCLQTITRVANISYLKQLKFFTILQASKEFDFFDKYVEIKACIENMNLIV